VDALLAVQEGDTPASVRELAVERAEIRELVAVLCTKNA
jgi:hypothetical protein